MTVRALVWNLMQHGVHLTADEIAGALDLPVLSVRPRVCELARANELKPSGTKKNRRGNTMTIWTRA